MVSNFNEFMDEFNVHTSTSNSNPHKANSKQIWGLDNVENTSDAAKPVTTALQKERDKKVNVVDIYNSTIDDSTKDITNLPFAKCEQNV